MDMMDMINQSTKVDRELKGGRHKGCLYLEGPLGRFREISLVLQIKFRWANMEVAHQFLRHCSSTPDPVVVLLTRHCIIGPTSDMEERPSESIY